VDDQAFVRRLITRIADRYGFRPLEAASVGEALALLRSTPVDVVTCDLRFPDEEGLDLLRAMKAEEKLRDIPVIMISAVGEDAPFDLALQLGAYDVLKKPFGTRDLVEVLRGAVATRRQGGVDGKSV